MNRRGFLGAMLKAGVAAMILPPALAGARKWYPTLRVSSGGIHVIDHWQLTPAIELLRHRIVFPPPVTIDDLWGEIIIPRQSSL